MVPAECGSVMQGMSRYALAQHAGRDFYVRNANMLNLGSSLRSEVSISNLQLDSLSSRYISQPLITTPVHAPTMLEKYKKMLRPSGLVFFATLSCLARASAQIAGGNGTVSTYSKSFDSLHEEANGQRQDSSDLEFRRQ